MVINLTEIGWTDENGIVLGTWTNQSDLVNENTAINLAQNLTVNTLNGDDIINSNTESEGIFIDGNSQLNTGRGNDTIFSAGFIAIQVEPNSVINTGKGNDTLSGDGFDGFFIRPLGKIATGQGNDLISGTGFAIGVGSRGTINTGLGNDIIRGIASSPANDSFGSTGIANSSGEINTGRGNDVIFAQSGQVAIDNPSGEINTGRGNDVIFAQSEQVAIDNPSGEINTGRGNDIIFAQSEQVAINNSSGTINTGRGDDIIDALTGGFSDSEGYGQINLGQDDDLIRGFGDHRGDINGGRGYDRAELGLDYDETLITLGSTDPASIDITFDSATMSFTNLELFDFNGQKFSLEELQNEI